MVDWKAAKWVALMAEMMARWLVASMVVNLVKTTVSLLVN
jgi:hypothetical protein